MKIKLLFLFILISNYTISQNSFYVDSLQISLKNYSKKEQLHQILKIPYDKFIGNIITSEILAQKAVKLANELNDYNSLADAYVKLSLVYAYKDKREKKITNNLKAIRIYEKIGNIEKAGYSYGELGFLIKHEDFEAALYYMRKGIKLFEGLEDINKADATYDNYGTLQEMLKNYDSAIYYHSKSLQIKKKNKDSIGIPYGYAHLASVNIHLNNFNVAKKYIDSSQVIRLLRKDTYGITENYVYYGDLYFAKKEYKKSIEKFKKGYHLSIKNHFISLQKYCANYLTKSYLALNDYKNAFNYNNIYQNLKDSTLNAKTNTKVAELQIEFETEKKEKEIAQQKEELLENKLEIKNKNLIAILLGSVMLLLGVISYGLFKRQKHKRKEFQNELALKKAQTYNKLQDQRLRISRDLHDNIGSQLTFIISSIDNLKFITKKSDEVLKNKLSEINQFANNTISQLRDTIWAMNKNKISFEDFQGRVLTFIEKAKRITTNTHLNYTSTVKNNIVFSSIKGINIFRVIQEAINNAIKYANASKIIININETTNELIIEIKDNGTGFNLNTVELGNGLKNMQHRIEEINGKITINSGINRGTTITISCLKNKANAV
ncbi:tetratricopeptide repeat-containing sensor histidine kinase [Lutibacter sp.]